MKTRAAVARAAGKPLEIEEIELSGPRAGEVLVEIKATGVCHTDEFTLSGADPEGKFPAILGHEGAGVVLEVGAGVGSVAPGDHVIPLYTPECRQCKSCHVAQDEPVHGDSRDPGAGPDARRHEPLLRRGRHDLPLHGHVDLREPHRAAGDRRRENPEGRPVREDLLHRLRRNNWYRRGDQHRESERGRERGRVRARRHRPQRDPRAATGRREQDRRRRLESRASATGRGLRHDPLRKSRAT